VPRKKYWIQSAIKKRGALEGFMQRKLGIPKSKRIPATILKKIANAKAGDTIELKYGKKKARVRVTRELERRAILALTLRKIRMLRRRKRG